MTKESEEKGNLIFGKLFSDSDIGVRVEMMTECLVYRRGYDKEKKKVEEGGMKGSGNREEDIVSLVRRRKRKDRKREGPKKKRRSEGVKGEGEREDKMEEGRDGGRERRREVVRGTLQLALGSQDESEVAQDGGGNVFFFD